MRVDTYCDNPAPLPRQLFIVQDGGYFYVFRDEEHSNTDEESPLRFVDSGLDPEFGDIKGAQAARQVVTEWLAEHEIIFG